MIRKVLETAFDQPSGLKWEGKLNNLVRLEVYMPSGSGLILGAITDNHASLIFPHLPDSGVDLDGQSLYCIVPQRYWLIPSGRSPLGRPDIQAQLM
jgi:hypothetical protein